ncbi:PAAR domain-containing protein [Halomonas elongata]|uniref:PAAR domain-containing protein n=1 Tax=Halomonas elongata TaxID=2746 RepID=UPI0038D3BA61
MDVGKIGDRVVCNCKGGPHSIVSGASTGLVDGIPIARVGDRSSCGASITSGLSWYLVDGSPAAINGSATSCGGHIVTASSAVTGTPSGFTLAPRKFSENQNSAKSRYQAEADDSASSGDESKSDDNKEGSRIKPGFHVVRRPGTREDIKRRLLASPRPDVDAMFERLNTHLGDYVLPGSLVVLSDPENQQCSAEETALQDQARKAQAVTQQLEPNQAQAMINSWGALGELQAASQTLGNVSTQGGTVIGGLSNLKTASAETLDEIAKMADQSADYVRAKGQEAFRRLSDIATGWVNQPFDLPDTAHSLKQAIGVQVDQVVHTIGQAVAGIPAFRVPTLAEAIRSAGRLVKPLNYANYLMVGLDYTATRMEVERGCRLAAGPEECRRVALVEYGKLAGRTGGAMVGGFAGSNACLAFGVTPVTLGCALAVGAAGAYGGMEGGDSFGRWSGELIYKLTTDPDEGVPDTP